MTYLALLVHCMVRGGHFRQEFFTDSGSAHGSNHLFPDHIKSNIIDENYRYLPVTLEHWKNWHAAAVRDYSKSDVCILRSSWSDVPIKIWGKGIASVDQSVALISSPNTKLDWLYCWFNMINKIPRNVYSNLRFRSKFYPKLWSDDKLKAIPKHIKISEMAKAMPVQPISEDIKTNKPTLRFMTTEILDEKFPILISNFLNSNDIPNNLSEDLLRWHGIFISKQMDSYERALEICKGRIDIRGPFDDILFQYLSENDPWTTEGHPR